jgi:hypothetical protein
MMLTGLFICRSSYCFKNALVLVCCLTICRCITLVLLSSSSPRSVAGGCGDGIGVAYYHFDASLLGQLGDETDF